jgi:hypothetical protein
MVFAAIGGRHLRHRQRVVGSAQVGIARQGDRCLALAKDWERLKFWSNVVRVAWLRLN